VLPGERRLVTLRGRQTTTPQDFIQPRKLFRCGSACAVIEQIVFPGGGCRAGHRVTQVHDRPAGRCQALYTGGVNDSFVCQRAHEKA
jgi:hypothetical protein